MGGVGGHADTWGGEIGGGVLSKVANAKASRWECTWCVGGHCGWGGVSREGGRVRTSDGEVRRTTYGWDGVPLEGFELRRDLSQLLSSQDSLAAELVRKRLWGAGVEVERP